MIVWRMYGRSLVPRSAPYRRRTAARRPGPTAAGRTALGRGATSTVAVSPGARSLSTATVAPSTTAGLSRVVSRGILDRALEAAVVQAQVRLDQRDRDIGVSARIVRSDPKPTARSRTIARVALEDVERRRVAVAAEEVAADRRRQECAAGDADLVGAARRREDADVDLRGPVGGAGRATHERDLVDDDVTAAQGRPEPVCADGEDRDQDRHRHPGPLAPVEPPQDEVVDRARPAGCRPTSRAIRPPIGGSARDGSWETAPTSWLSSRSDQAGADRGGSTRRQNVRRPYRRRSTSPSGRSRRASSRRSP